MRNATGANERGLHETPPVFAAFGRFRAIRVSEDGPTSQLHSEEQRVRHYCTIETRMGHVGLAARDGKLTRTTLPKRTREQALREIAAGLGKDAVEDEAAFGDLPSKLRRYFEGERVDLSAVKVDLSRYGTFHANVIQAAQGIPYGRLVTYGELAKMAGSERAARAAGSAMAGNNTPIIVPCHRVIASGGKIGGFSSGLEWKRELLRLEGVDI